MSSQEIVSRVELPLHEAIRLALDSVVLRMQGTEFNLFYLIDKPGAGKTKTIAYEVARRGWGLCPYSPALERLEKFGGIPDLFWHDTKEEQEHTSDTKKELRTIWSIPQMISEINDMAKVYPYVVVLFDDWHLCDEDLQKIGFELFTYYKLNNNPVGKNVVFVLAGNESSAAGAKTQLSAIKNRSTLIYCRADVSYWLKNFAAPNSIHPLGISFFRNPLNHDIFQEAESAVDQFGSPRSWTSMLNLIQFLEKHHDRYDEEDDGESVLPRRFIQAIVQGSVSRRAYERFMLHYDIYSHVDLVELFDRGIIKIPADNVECFCYSTAATYEFYSRWVRGDKKERDQCSKVYAKMISELKKKNEEMTANTCMTLGNIPENAETGYPAGMLVLADQIRSKYISQELVLEIKDITKLLGSNA